jgi:hypothetical protein
MEVGLAAASHSSGDADQRIENRSNGEAALLQGYELHLAF